MKNGYDQFFKNARQAAPKPTSVKFQKNTPASRTGQKMNQNLKLNISSEEMLEQELRNRIGVRTKKKKRGPFPWKMVGVSFIGLLVALWGFHNYEKVEHFVKNVEVDFLGAANASEAKDTKKAADKEAKKDGKGEDKAKAAEGKEALADAEAEAKREVASETDPDHLQKLIDRKKELDGREEELARVETELAAQKVELEKRMKELEEMRARISSTLEERVKVDEQKIETLVQMYSQMKAPQAAKVFETLDEDLAVEVIGRMKKKNAADIMNLLKPEKAQLFSEKFAGYKRK